MFLAIKTTKSFMVISMQPNFLFSVTVNYYYEVFTHDLQSIKIAVYTRCRRFWELRGSSIKRFLDSFCLYHSQTILVVLKTEPQLYELNLEYFTWLINSSYFYVPSRQMFLLSANLMFSYRTSQITSQIRELAQDVL